MEKFVKGTWWESNIHFRECEKKQLPFVVIKDRRKYSSVEFDFITMNSKNDKIIQSNMEKIHKWAIDYFFPKYMADNKAELQITGMGLISIDRIKKEKVEAAAIELYNYILATIQSVESNENA